VCVRRTQWSRVHNVLKRWPGKARHVKQNQTITPPGKTKESKRGGVGAEGLDENLQSSTEAGLQCRRRHLAGRADLYDARQHGRYVYFSLARRHRQARSGVSGQIKSPPSIHLKTYTQPYPRACASKIGDGSSINASHSVRTQQEHCAIGTCQQ
jgi:hypothetical protein